jgi:hypothetical protein
MSELNIECPECGHHFELTEALAGPMLEEQRRKVTAETERRLAAEARTAADAAVQKARVEWEASVAELKKQKEASDAQVAKARDAEIAALRAKQEAEAAKRAMDVEVARRVAESEQRVASEAKAGADEALRKARAESEAKIAELKREKEASDAQVAKAREAETAALRAKREAEEAKAAVDLEVARRVAEEAAVAAQRARTEALKEGQAQLEEVRREVAEKDAKLAAAQTAEVEARRAMREAEEAKREVAVLVERRLDEERASVRERALKERDDEYRLKIQEKERQLAELKDKLDEAQRKADQGSQQLKGDVLEVDLYETLRAAFPGDEIERVKKGQKGGDLIHTVRSSSGLVCGRIKWESKHTQNWSDAWLPKVREDQRAHKCDAAAIMTETLPETVTYFDLVDGVWVSSIGAVVCMATALRHGLIETATARRAAAGAATSKDLVYNYLTSPEFRGRVMGVVEPLVEMRTSLEAEKRAAERMFAARAKQLDRVGLNLTGMYGDLQGLVGPNLPTVQGLALPNAAAECGEPTAAAVESASSSEQEPANSNVH